VGRNCPIAGRCSPRTLPRITEPAKVKRKSDYARKGGALLLGVQKPMVLAHGASDARAIRYAIEFAHEAVKKEVVSKFNQKLSEQIAKHTSGALRVAQKVKDIFRSSRS